MDNFVQRKITCIILAMSKWLTVNYQSFAPAEWITQAEFLFLAKFSASVAFLKHDDVIKWKHIPRYWLFVRGIHRSPMNSLHNGQWRGALMFLSSAPE